MKAKAILAVVIGAAIVFSLLAYAFPFLIDLYYPNTGSITNNPDLTVYVDGILSPTNTIIPWGQCDPDSVYLLSLNVTNTGNQPLLVTCVPEGLPADWTATWTVNGTTLNPGASIEADFELGIPATASSWPTWGFHIYGE
jgi:hypothetical protein